MVEDQLLTRLQKQTVPPMVKLKCLRVAKHCVLKGDLSFKRDLQRRLGPIRACLGTLTDLPCERSLPSESQCKLIHCRIPRASGPYSRRCPLPPDTRRGTSTLQVLTVPTHEQGVGLCLISIPQALMNSIFDTEDSFRQRIEGAEGRNIASNEAEETNSRLPGFGNTVEAQPGVSSRITEMFSSLKSIGSNGAFLASGTMVFTKLTCPVITSCVRVKEGASNQWTLPLREEVV